MFGFDLSMLMLHLNEVGPLFDVIVVCESDHSFRNHPKPFILSELIKHGKSSIDPRVLKKLFIAQWKSKKSGNPWENEGAQRTAAGIAAESIRLSSELYELPMVVCCHDADEIPRADDLERLRERAAKCPWKGTLRGDMDMFVFNMRWKAKKKWTLPAYLCIPPGKDQELPSLGLARWRIAEPKDKTSVVTIRNTNNSSEPVGCRGWHLSWFGDRKLKFHTFSHHDDLAVRGGEKMIEDAEKKGVAPSMCLETLERVDDVPKPRLLSTYFPSAV